MVNLIGVRIDNKDYITAVFSDEYDNKRVLPTLVKNVKECGIYNAIEIFRNLTVVDGETIANKKQAQIIDKWVDNTKYSIHEEKYNYTWRSLTTKVRNKFSYYFAGFPFWIDYSHYAKERFLVNLGFIFNFDENKIEIYSGDCYFDRTEKFGRYSELSWEYSEKRTRGIDLLFSIPFSVTIESPFYITIDLWECFSSSSSFIDDGPINQLVNNYKCIDKNPAFISL